MSRGALGPAPPELLERDVELVRLDAALAAASRGHGGVVAIVGPAGAGKSALLAVARARFAAAGAEVRSARASELECDYAFGGVRQLLAGADLLVSLDGVARAVAPVLAMRHAVVEPPPPFAVLDGLTAVLKTFAGERPVVLAIDDAHWLDAPSVRWLDYLSRRLDGLAVLVILTVREAAAQQLSLPLSRLLGDPRLELCSLDPLGPGAVATLLEARLGTAAAPALIVGCVAATGGNAFAVCELIAALELDGRDQAAAAMQLTQRVPATIARSIRARLSALDPDAVTLARALAVLGDGAPLRQVAALAGMEAGRAGAMSDELAGAELLLPARPLAFVHPLIRSAITDDLAPGVLARLHADAAGLLAAEDGDPEAIAAHLLRADAVGDADAARRLRAAASLALRRGAPDVAVTYLARADAEPPAGADRVGVLHELGRAELMAGVPAGVAHLQEALARAAGDPVTRARVGVDLFDGMAFAGQWLPAIELIGRLRDELDDRDPAASLAVKIRVAFGVIERDPGTGAELREIERAGRASPEARVLLLLLALVLALRGERCGEVPGLVTDGLADGAFLREYSADSILAVHAIDALGFVDALPAAAALADAVCADAARRGLVLGAVAGVTHRGFVALRGGRLLGAERDLRDALSRAREHQLRLTFPFIAGYLAEALAAQGRPDEAAAVLGTVPETAIESNNAAAATLLMARGTVALARGERAVAVADLRACGAHLTEMGARNPVLAPWRSTLALALGPEAHDEAVALVGEELGLARAAGLARGVGVAQLAQAQLVSGEAAVELLEAAVSEFTVSPAVLEHAQALGALGAALRRRGRVVEARTRLREALDGASRCGATGLAAALTAELHVAGARPRAPWLTGVESLTPSELRVARLAAGGISNREIAAALVITTKTVKHHLGSVYRKMDIASRRELLGSGLDVGPGQLGSDSPASKLSAPELMQ